MKLGRIRRNVQNVFIIMIILDTILFSSRGRHYMQVEVYQNQPFQKLQLLSDKTIQIT